MNLMPDAAIIPAAMGDAPTAGAEHARNALARGTSVTSLLELGDAPTSDYLAGLIEHLRAIIDALPVELPEPLDGETWLCLDSAVTGLYGALAALEEIGRRPIGSIDLRG